MLFGKRIVIGEQSIYNQIQSLKGYLLSTDWYVIRLTDCGKPIPENIILKRNEARNKINLLGGES